MPKPDYDQFPKEETPDLQDVAWKLDQDLKRMKTHFQLLQSDKVTLEGEFARYKKATRHLIKKTLDKGAKWVDIQTENKQYLKSIGFKPEDFG
jgi:cell division protein ZapA (FtsZ GTPase activity inhibitor)